MLRLYDSKSAHLFVLRKTLLDKQKCHAGQEITRIIQKAGDDFTTRFFCIRMYQSLCIQSYTETF